MKRVFTDSVVSRCDLIRCRLESAGIPSMLKNERGSMIAGEGLPVFSEASLAFAWPEVWVNDEDESRARTIIAETGGEVSLEELEQESSADDDPPPV